MPKEKRTVTLLSSDPYDDRSGPWFSQADLHFLRSLPAGTKLVVAPEQPPRVGGDEDAA